METRHIAKTKPTETGKALNRANIANLINAGEQRLRDPALAAVVSIEAGLIRGARQYFDESGFTEVVVPHITRATGACENIATMFDLNYFGERAYLVQTGQLYLEALIPKLGKVFCIGPSFRAETDVDERHLTEFTMVEFELPCDFDTLLVHIENTVKAMIRSVLRQRQDALEMLGADKSHLLSAALPFKRITYTDAIELLQTKGFNVQWGDDLKSTHEKRIVEEFGRPTFITHYPEAIKFFNMRRNEENPEVVNSADLILPYSGEAVGSAQREHNHKILEGKLLASKMLRMLEEKGGSVEDFRWYLDFVKENPMQHSGCGIGLNRVTQFVLASRDIRATTAFPMNRISLM